MAHGDERIAIISRQSRCTTCGQRHALGTVLTSDSRSVGAGLLDGGARAPRMPAWWCAVLLCIGLSLCLSPDVSLQSIRQALRGRVPPPSSRSSLAIVPPPGVLRP